MSTSRQLGILLSCLLIVSGCTAPWEPPDGDGSDDDTGDDDSTPPPPHALADVELYINLGDSLAAGYNAAGNNGSGGHGYARLLVDNHPAYSAYNGATLSAVSGGVYFHDVSDSGATSDEILDNLEDALDGSLPATVNGDVLLTISAGGNDFNDSIWTMVTPALATAAADNLALNLTQMISLVRARYEVPAQGIEVIPVLINIQDPTGGTMSIPAQYEDGFCETIQHPAHQAVGGLVLSNLATMNDAIESAAPAQGGQVADMHAAFLDHGMNASGADKWLSDDCAHPNDEGHHQLRREIWGTVSGEWF